MTDKTPFKIQKMFDEISKRYDFFNNLISFGTHKLIKYLAFKNLKIKKEDKILDLCTGTGDIPRILKNIEPKAEITGLDFSQNMIEIACKRHKDINFIKGDACNLNFKENFFDIVTISFGLRNIDNRYKALSEIYRVLKRGGYFAHLDFSPENKFSNFIFDKFALFFTRIFKGQKSAYEYLIQSKNEYKKPEDLIKEFEEHGFECIFKKGFLFNTIFVEICVKKCYNEVETAV